MSGSMASKDKIEKIKSILHRIIINVNVNKDKLAVVGFKGDDSEIIIPNTKRPSSFLNNLQKITVGGTTPMATGLKKGLEISKKELKKGEYLPVLMILSDGVTNVGLRSIYLQSKKKNKETITNPRDDVLNVAKEIAKNKIHTIIINFEKEEGNGRSVNKELVSITKGNFYDLTKISADLKDNSDAIIDEILNFERENI
jgi:magnesium chelatase subunit D